MPRAQAIPLALLALPALALPELALAAPAPPAAPTDAAALVVQSPEALEQLEAHGLSFAERLGDARGSGADATNAQLYAASARYRV
jgi:hypothetical protein